MENKFLIGVGIIAVTFSYIALVIAVGGRSQSFSGVSGSSYDVAATGASISCSGSTSTVVVAASSGRLSFLASRTGGQTITLCRRSTGCVAGSGIILSTTTLDRFEQNDGYTGAYSCIGTGGTSTLGVSYQ